jgi:hypothetical protein
MVIRTLAACIVLAGFLAGCGRDQRAWTGEDEWYNPLPADTHRSEWDYVPRDRFHEVTEVELAGAVGLLQQVSSLALTAQQASDLIGTALPAVPGTQPYLVRGLLLNRGTGSFAVYLMEDQVAVKHGSLGKRAMPMTRQPLVLQLQQAPGEVYVSVSMAE